MVASVLVLSIPTLTRGQSLVVHGSAGPTLVDRGYNLAAGVGWAPWSRITLSGTLERTHLSSRVSSDFRGGSTAFRGGTLTLAAAELRVSLFARDRATPYVLAGYAAGVSQPTVNQTFTGRVTNDVRAVFGGAGIQVPLRPGHQPVRRWAHDDWRRGQRTGRGRAAADRCELVVLTTP